MAKGYRPVRRDQGFLLPPDMREWLPGDHPVWLVVAVVEDHLDTSAFHAGRRAGGAGAAGYDPDMLVALLVWAYACGVTSSRRIEAACRQDVAFRVICAGDVPDHVTIARFRAASGGAVEALFSQVLGLCARLGMGQAGTVALDGMKIAASASKSANRTERRLRELAAERAAAHAAADAAEDELFGPGRRGDEVPPEAASPATRDERIRQALAELEAGRKAAGAEQAAQDRKAGEYLARGGRVPGSAPAAVAVAAARARLAAARAARAAQISELERRAAGPPARGRRRDRPRAGIEDYCKVAAARAALAAAEARAQARAQRAARQDTGPGPVRNLTDPHSRLMPTRNGFIQGYNAQNVASEDGLIIATKLTSDPADMAWLEPMLAAAADAAALIGARQPAPAAGQRGIGLVLADAGYCSERNLTIAGPDRLIATGKHRDLEKAARQARPGQMPARDGPVAAMAARLATEAGITAYRRRGHIAETPHGQIKHNMRFRQLTMRGKHKAAAEWTFTCTVHNLLKAITTGHLTPAALAALPG